MKKLKVLIEVVGGIPHVITCDDGVELEIRDYDVDEADPDLTKDENGKWYFDRY